MPKKTIQGLATNTRHAVKIQASSNLGVGSGFSEAVEFTTPPGTLLANGPIIFDFPGTLTTISSDLYMPPSDWQLTEIIFTVKIPSTSGAITVGLNLNEAQVAVATIPQGAAFYDWSITPFTITGKVDTVQLQILSSGTGASGLVGIAI